MRDYGKVEVEKGNRIHESRKGAPEGGGATRSRERAIGETENDKSTKIKYVCKCDQILCVHPQR